MQNSRVLAGGDPCRSIASTWTLDRLLDSGFRPVPPEHVFDADVQAHHRLRAGCHQENVRDLLASSANGWLDDRSGVGSITCRRREPAGTTLKYLERRYEEDAIESRRTRCRHGSCPSFSTRTRVPEITSGSMGLHPLRKAALACHQPCTLAMERRPTHGDADAVALHQQARVQIGANVGPVNAYEASDYGDQLQSEQYNLFREVLKSARRTWLGVGFQSVEPQVTRTGIR